MNPSTSQTKAARSSLPRTTRRALRVVAPMLVMISFWCGAQTLEEMFQRGNDFYRTGKFKEAAAAYDSILAQGSISAEVYFNLGNSYFRQGNTARAILNFERAARLKPGDADIQHNLRLVSLRTVDRIDPVPELFLSQWLRTVTESITPTFAAGVLESSWVLFFASLSVMFVTRAPGMLKTARRILLTTVPVVLLSGAFVLTQQIQESRRSSAIVIAPVVTAKSSPDEQSVDAFVIHEGLKVNVSDAVGDWVKITLPDGKVGWMKAGQCELI